MIQVKDYCSVSKSQLEDFFAKESESDDPSAANMKEMIPLIHERFVLDGCFHVLMDDERIIGCSGAYVSNFSRDVALLGCRSWLVKEARNQSYIRDMLLPMQRSWAIKRETKIVALSFNEHNKNLRELFQRRVMKRIPRDHTMMFYNNIHVLDYAVNIQHVPQWVIYEKLSDWDFDWQSIRALDSQPS